MDLDVLIFVLFCFYFIFNLDFSFDFGQLIVCLIALILDFEFWILVDEMAGYYLDVDFVHGLWVSKSCRQVIIKAPIEGMGIDACLFCLLDPISIRSTCLMWSPRVSVPTY